MITDKLISSQQRGFMQGRSILDCTGRVSEAINLLDTKCCAGNIAIKIDIKKDVDIHISRDACSFVYQSKPEVVWGKKFRLELFHRQNLILCGGSFTTGDLLRKCGIIIVSKSACKMRCTPIYILEFSLISSTYEISNTPHVENQTS